MAKAEDKKKEKTPSDIAGDLWVLAGKLRGIGELFNMAGGEPPFSEEALNGLSHLLIELADEVEKLRELAEYG